MIGSKPHKSRVVAAVRILGRTRLAAHLYVGKIGHSTRTACDSHAHALGNLLIPSAVDRRVMPLEKLGRHHSVLYLLYDMGRYVMAAVGYRGRQVGYLQRSGKYLALTDGDGYDSGRAPVTVAVTLVVKLHVGDKSAILTREVDAELIAVALRNHVMLPHVKRLGHSAILALLVNHVFQTPTEIGVT